MTAAKEAARGNGQVTTGPDSLKRTQGHSTSHPQGKPETTLGSSLFLDPLAGHGTVAEIRQRLELKYVACLAIGKSNDCPLDVRRIKDARLRTLAAGGMIFKNWTIKDLIACSGELQGTAASVLVASLERPVWGPDDFRLMDLIERMEQMRSSAMRGGRTL